MWLLFFVTSFRSLVQLLLFSFSITGHAVTWRRRLPFKPWKSQTFIVIVIIINPDWFVRNRKKKQKWLIVETWQMNKEKTFPYLSYVNDLKLVISSNVDNTNGRQLHPIICQSKFKLFGTFPRVRPKFACSNTPILCKSELVFFPCVSSMRLGKIPVISFCCLNT